MTEMHPWLEKSAKLVHEVGTWHTVLTIVALAAHTTFFEEITKSDILRVFILGGAAFGGPIGYFRTAFVWAGKGRPKCVRRGLLYFVLWVLFFSLLVVLPIEILKPAVVHKLPCLEPVREWLVTFMTTTNFLIAFGCFLASFFFVGAITLCSAKLANPRHD
jgi:hypothetical protein